MTHDFAVERKKNKGKNYMFIVAPHKQWHNFVSAQNRTLLYELKSISQAINSFEFVFIDCKCNCNWVYTNYTIWPNLESFVACHQYQSTERSNHLRGVSLWQTFESCSILSLCHLTYRMRCKFIIQMHLRVWLYLLWCAYCWLLSAQCLGSPLCHVFLQRNCDSFDTLHNLRSNWSIIINALYAVSVWNILSLQTRTHRR